MPESITAAARGCWLLSASLAKFACWCSRWRRMSCSPSSTRPRLPPPAARPPSLQAFQQIRHALFEMGERRRVVVAGRDAIQPFGQRAQRAFEISELSLAAGRSRVSIDEVSAAMRCSSRQANRCCRRRGTIDRPWPTALHIVGNPRQRIVGGDVGDDRAHRRDRVFELTHRRRIVVRAQDQVELGAEIADRVVIAGELLGRLQRTQHFVDFARARARGWPAPGRRCRSGGSRRSGATASGFRSRSNSIAWRGIASVMARRISASSVRKAAIDCSTWSGRCSASIWLVILSRCRSSEEKSGPAGMGAGAGAGAGGGIPVRMRQAARRRHRRRRLRHRRRAARRHLPGRRTVQFVLARGDFGDRQIERRRAQRRRGTIDLRCGALDHLGLALPLLQPSGWRGAWIGNLRQPRIETRNGVVQLPRDGRLGTGRFGCGARRSRGGGP